MGLNFLFSASSYEISEKLPNPDPNRYEILRHFEIGNDLVVEIRYPDCTNYEGRKILVYESVTLEQLKSQRSIDPHFCNNSKYYSPLARFEPTEKGWDLATHLAGWLDLIK